MKDRIDAHDGLLYHIIKNIRPDLARKIKEKNKLETLIVGLGGQGSKHAGLMNEFGTDVAAGVAPGRGGSRVHETIPVYNTVEEALKEHPDIVAASIWRHYATARDAAIETVEAGIPIVVLITENIPLKDVRDIIVAARNHNTLLIGGNTPGLIFPPERIKIGMLPDIFYPEERQPGRIGSSGVTIISRSGAILYHMSDAMASVGIAQNGVIGIGGDGAVGSAFRDVVPLVMEYDKTDLVIIAGEIGGCQEEMLAEDIKNNPEKYPKPIVALISGANAPEGKTMGHAGAIIAPGQEMGTYISKKKALEDAGVSVVNSQYDLIEVVQKRLNGKRYFDPKRYYERMRRIWEAPPPKPTWGTMITKIEPNSIVVRGYKIEQIIEYGDLISAACLIVGGELPDKNILEELNTVAVEATLRPVPSIDFIKDEDISKSIVRHILNDREIAEFSRSGEKANIEKTIFMLGRFTAYIGNIFGNESTFKKSSLKDRFSLLICRAFLGNRQIEKSHSRMIESMIVASIDHGVTPPSAQATLIAASVRASYEVAIAHGIGAITDVHGGAGERAAIFFRECVDLSKREAISLKEATIKIMTEYIKSGRRIEGMGHRIHTKDPRRDVLWTIAEENGVAGDCVAISKMASELLRQVRGINLPVNVDGVIGAIIADMDLSPRIAKALFIFGRICGLSAHYFEEITTQPQMRRIDFALAKYKGPSERPYPV